MCPAEAESELKHKKIKVRKAGEISQNLYEGISLAQNRAVGFYH